MIDLSALGMAHIATYRDGTFDPCEPMPGAIYAKTMPVYDRLGEPVDLVAWASADPSRWWLRHGLATVLGEDDLNGAWWEERPVMLAATPAEWLEQRYLWPNKLWVCVLDWSADPRATLGLASEVVCTSTALQQKLKDEIARHVAPAFRIARAA
ncbi:hypothetical protein [Rhodospirillaceae bacterium SYSU D60014]|uniref:hypothetical protein n=1 Tax=Virgifigura deserti TaxID=2268457 RepID=UPI000E662B04